VRRVGSSKLNPLLRMAAMAGPMFGGQMGGLASLAEVYRVFPDGRQELLRGVELAELRPAAFRDIAAIGKEPVAINEPFLPNFMSMLSFGITFAGEPDMPFTSCISPALLFEDLSFMKSQGPFPRPAISESPLAAR